MAGIFAELLKKKAFSYNDPNFAKMYSWPNGQIDHMAVLVREMSWRRSDKSLSEQMINQFIDVYMRP